nr:A-kinase anchor protein 7 isoforms delta and gamma-like [Ipomoea batatas]
MDYSHFVSLPLAIHTELVNKLFNFQTSILGATESQTNSNIVYMSNLGIEKSTFNNPKTFHLTVLMLKLWNKALVEKAAEVLQSVSSKVIDALENRPVFVRLKGLECMKGSLANARVLYAPVEEIGSEGRLSRACQVIIDAFIEAGLVLEKDKEQKLKLHATVMNARHTKGRSRKNRSFDARTIIKCYDSEEWGEYLIREAHLSQRFAYDENGYYRCCASIPFPSDSQLG